MNNPSNDPSPTTGQSRFTPKRISSAIGDWVRATIVVIAWATALVAALAAAVFVVKIMIYFVNLGQRALFP